MKKTTNIILLIASSLIFSGQMTNQFWEKGELDDSSFLDKIHTNHYFSMSSNSFNNTLNTYGIYGNSTSLNLNSKTRIYGDFSIMQPMSGQSNFEKLNYSVGLGLNYQLNNNTFLSFEISKISSPSISHSVGLQDINRP